MSWHEKCADTLVDCPLYEHTYKGHDGLAMRSEESRSLSEHLLITKSPSEPPGLRPPLTWGVRRTIRIRPAANI